MKKLLVSIITFTLAVSGIACAEPEPKQSAELAALYAKALQSNTIGDWQIALKELEEVFSAEVVNPGFEEFLIQIKAVENSLDIYQKLYDLSHEGQYKKHIHEYINLLSQKYDQAIQELKQKNDFLHAISLAEAIYGLYKNNGHYTSVSNVEHEFFLESAFKNTYQAKILHYKNEVNALFKLAINASLRSPDKNATDKLVALEKQWNNGNILPDESIANGSKDKRKSIFNIFKK